MDTGSRRPPRVAIFGHFGVANFGNESTLQAVLHHLRRLQPDAEVTCICSNAELVAEQYGVRTVRISDTVLARWRPRSSILRGARRAIVGLPSEPYRWLKTYRVLREMDMLVIPGTGLLTDINGLLGFGPYSVFKWVLIAKRCGCKVLFVSVGAGPLSSNRGRQFARGALRRADYRSYRDSSTKDVLRAIGFDPDADPVYPDLAFSLPVTRHERVRDGRPVVGIGVMAEPEKLTALATDAAISSAYIEALVGLAEHLLGRGFDLRLLIGDVADERAKRDFLALLGERVPAAATHVSDEPVTSVESLLAQIEATDTVVATRFHNVLLGFVLDKPVLAISFHHKCESLMEAMGLPGQCVDLRGVTAEALIAGFAALEAHADEARALAAERTRDNRDALDEQYRQIFA